MESKTKARIMKVRFYLGDKVLFFKNKDIAVALGNIEKIEGFGGNMGKNSEGNGQILQFAR